MLASRDGPADTGTPPLSLPWREPVEAFRPFQDEAFALLLHDGRNGRARLFADPAKTFLGDSRDTFDQLAAAYREPGRSGMFAGLFGYDLAGAFEVLPALGLRWPAVAFAHYPAWADFDREAGTILVYGATLEQQSALASRLTGPSDAAPASTPRAHWQARWTREAYLEAARRARDYVHAGDVFQVNLSQAFDVTLGEGDTPYAVFDRLCTSSPAPHAAYLRLDETRVIVTNSPERFVSLTDGEAEARPIKGTRPRAADPVRDAQLAEELASSAKDRAENLMIVDLMRNDLARVCRPGSVDVPELCEIESYANVHHLVSSVRGRLADDRDAFDLIEASFPPGSITGAPKVRAMEIISELEGEPRGPYCGALGWIGPDGDLDLNVMIRTAAFRRAGDSWRATVRSGGGIVADSDPQAEYVETLDKASALRAAMGADG